MKLTTTILISLAALTAAAPAEVKRAPTGLDFALLESRCPHRECHCTSFDPNSCSGPDCGKPCNTGLVERSPFATASSGLDYALLEARCPHRECHCTSFDPNSCSGPGCHKQCNTGLVDGESV